jgi:lysophospholipase L1-like esterase
MSIRNIAEHRFQNARSNAQSDSKVLNLLRPLYTLVRAKKSLIDRDGSLAMKSVSPRRGWRPPNDAILATIIAVLVVCGAVGGFFIGRTVARHAFVKKVSGLVEAGTAPLSLYQSMGRAIDDPVTAQAMTKAYDVPLGNHNALIKRLSEVASLPPYQPAPFIGHIARQFSSDNLHINALGFRDRREHLERKDDRTVRIFVTGGSTAWGVGASSDEQTISGRLEQKLNARLSSRTSYRYEVINTAFPAWSTTQEKILIEQRLVDLHPDVILMFSGNNDIHWALNDRDIRWFFSLDQNYFMLLNEMYKIAGHDDWIVAFPRAGRRIECSEVAEIAERNVGEAVYAAARVNAQLFFVLQPNIVSTTKHLTLYEQRLLQGQDKPYWDRCYQTLRETLARIKAKNYRFLDLSRSFGMLSDSTELFIDAYHITDLGNQLVAKEMAEQIGWETLVPNDARASAQTPP